MTTNSPNPVEGDVQALIADCQQEIESLKWKIDRTRKSGGTLVYLESCLARQEVALAALKAEPVAYTDAEELETLRKGTFADMFTPHETYKADQLWIPLYTTPPAKLLRPVELPQSFYGVVQDGKAVMLPANDGQWLNKTAVIEALRKQGYEVK
ncbi:hypothetical protein ACQV2B_02745 [Pantoea allii]|uniref:hypothetical protein n=1 Tax=Pantoea allii TaxID=574096 RepID=UPI003D318574